MVLGSSAQKGYTADVNLLNGLSNGNVDLVDGLLEGVKVADNEVNLGNILVGQILLVGLDVASKNTTVDSGVEGLDTATEHLRGVSDSRNIPND